MKKIALGAEGTGYILNCLHQNGGLAALLRARVENSGTTFTPFPAYIDALRARQFNVGGINCRREVQSWFVNYVRQLPSGVLVFQDLWAKPSDLISRPSAYEDYFVCDEAVYYFVRTKIFNRTMFDRVLKQISSFIWLGVYLRQSFGVYNLPRGIVQGKALTHKMAENALMLTVDAYDQEGLVVWQASELLKSD